MQWCVSQTFCFGEEEYPRTANGTVYTVHRQSQYVDRRIGDGRRSYLHRSNIASLIVWQAADEYIQAGLLWRRCSSNRAAVMSGKAGVLLRYDHLTKWFVHYWCTTNVVGILLSSSFYRGQARQTTVYKFWSSTLFGLYQTRERGKQQPNYIS